MTTVYFDSKMTDAERRGKIFAGDIFVFSPRQSTLAFVDFARELIEAAFAPLPPVSCLSPAAMRAKLALKLPSLDHS